MQFRHFNHAQKRLTIFTKGGKVQTIPIVDPAFWNELGRHILDWQAQPNEYLLCRQHTIPRWDSEERKQQKPDRIDRVQYRDQPMGVHGLHSGGIAASLGAAWSLKGKPPVSACTRHGTPPASVSSMPPRAT